MLNDGPIHWFSSRQELPALSSTEAEIIAGVNCLRYTLHLRELLEGMGYPQGVTTIHMDAQNAIRFTLNEKITKRNHHIGVRYHRMQQHVRVGDVKLQFVRSIDQNADLLTKNTAQETFNTLCERVMHSFGDA